MTDKVMPHSLEAEEAVLGSLLIDNSSYFTICNELTPDDFYRDKNRFIYEARQKLDMCDQVTMAHQLALEGRLEAIGGASYLSHLIANVATSVHIEYYAEILQKLGDSRRLIRAGLAISDLGYEQKEDGATEALKEILSLKKKARDIVTPEDLSDYALGYYDSLENGDRKPVLFGVKALDNLGGMQPGELVVFGGETEMGKGLVNGTKILTPGGWRKIENLYKGSIVIDSNGYPTEILGVYPQGLKACYRFTFDDGTFIESDGSHLWKIQTKYARHCKETGHGVSNKQYSEWRIESTDAIIKRCGGFGEVPIRKRFLIPTVGPINFPSIPVTLDPYLLGVLLGDGCLRDTTPRLSTMESEIVQYIRTYLKLTVNHIAKYDYTILGISEQIRELGLYRTLSNNKFVPQRYLFNDVPTRLAVLRGLLDTDGSIERDGETIEYCTCSKQLAEDVMFLVRSLGGKCKIHVGKTNYTYLGRKLKGQDRHRVNIKINNFNPFLITRKANRHHLLSKTFCKVIRRIDKVPDMVETTCIRVSSPTKLFIAKDFIVTHNTTAMNQIARHQKGPVLFCTTEMTRAQWSQREVARIMGVRMENLGNPLYLKANHQRWLKATEDLKKSNVHILVGSVTTKQIYAEAANLPGCCLIIIDYLQRLKGVRATYESVSTASREIADMAKVLETPVILSSQLSRDTNVGKDGKVVNRPLLTRLKDSGNIENDSDWVMFIKRNKEAKRNTPEFLDATILVEKHKQGGDHVEVKLRFNIESQAYEEVA